MKGRAAVAIAGFAAAALLATGLVHGAAPTDAAWVKTEKRSSVVTATALAAPTGLTCKSGTKTVLILTTNTATLSWNAVAHAPGETMSYVLESRNPSQTNWNFVARTTDTSVKFETDLLGGVLGGVINLLFGAGTESFRVRAAVGDNWVSPPSAETPGVRKTVLLVDGLGGYKCA